MNPLGNIFEFNNVDDIFQSKQFVKLLQKAIIKRNNCKNHCEFFDICKGGCLNDEECKEKKFFSVYKEIETKLRDIIQNEDFSKLNPELSKIILSGAASNKLFEKGLYK